MFTLPDLPYSFDALEPHIDKQTMEIHHDRHHATYVNNLNAALDGQPDWLEKSIEDILERIDTIPDEIRTPVRNNGGGHFNHSLFWTLMTPNESEAKGNVVDAINKEFSSLDKFKELFTTAGTSRFGSGWVWLVVKGDKLEIGSTANQDNPLMGEVVAGLSGTPILCLDVWEHAYYLHYQNKRPDYITAWWNLVNWEEVEKLFNSATS